MFSMTRVAHIALGSFIRAHRYREKGHAEKILGTGRTSIRSKGQPDKRGYFQGSPSCVKDKMR